MPSPKTILPQAPLDTGLAMGRDMGAAYYAPVTKPPIDTRSIWVVQTDAGSPFRLALYDDKERKYRFFKLEEED